MGAEHPILNPSPPVNVLHLVSTFAFKTDTKWLVQIAKHLDRRRFRLSAACFYEGGPVQDQLEGLGVKTYNLDMPCERDPRAVVRAQRLMRELDCAIVHTHLLRADLYGGTAARWSGVPVIVSTAYAIGAYRRQKKRRSDRLLDAACAWLPTRVIAVSHAVWRDCVDRLGMDPADVSVIHTGIDPPEEVDADRVVAVRAEWGIPRTSPLIVTIARLSYEKGIDALIDAAGELVRKHPAARIVVLGEGPQRSELEERIRSRGVSEVVRLAGFVADVWPALAAADVVCMPSKSEGMPNVLLEAMAVGKPIVATAVGGIPEAITSEQNGLLVEANAPGELAAALGRMLEDKDLAAQLSAGARQTVQERFLARDVVAQYADLYSRLLELRNGARGRASAIN